MRRSLRFRLIGRMLVPWLRGHDGKSQMQMVAMPDQMERASQAPDRNGWCWIAGSERIRGFLVNRKEITEC